MAYVGSISNNEMRNRLLQADISDILADTIDLFVNVRNESTVRKKKSANEQTKEKPIEKLSLEQTRERYTQIREKVDDFLGLAQSRFPPPVIDKTIIEKGAVSIMGTSILSTAGSAYAATGIMQIIHTVGTAAEIAFAYKVFKQYTGTPAWYMPHFNLIGMKPESKVITGSILAHEYTHSRQPRVFSYPMWHSWLREGHAEGVARNVMLRYGLEAQTSENIKFECNGVLKNLTTFKRFYDRVHGLKNASNRKGFNIPNMYDIGVTATVLEERMQGTQIYRQMLDNTFKFKLL